MAGELPPVLWVGVGAQAVDVPQYPRQRRVQVARFAASGLGAQAAAADQVNAKARRGRVAVEQELELDEGVPAFAEWVVKPEQAGGLVEGVGGKCVSGGFKGRAGYMQQSLFEYFVCLQSYPFK